jgi:hypothetical protein
MTDKAQQAEPVLPYEVRITARDDAPGGVTFGKGVKLSTFIKAAQRWYRKACETFPPPADIDRFAFFKDQDSGPVGGRGRGATAKPAGDALLDSLPTAAIEIAASDGPALKCQYPMITTVDRSKDGNCTVKAVKHPDGTFEVIKVEFQGNPCPTCHGTGVVTNHGWSDDPTGEAKPVRPCPTCHGEKP